MGETSASHICDLDTSKSTPTAPEAPLVVIALGRGHPVPCDRTWSVTLRPSITFGTHALAVPRYAALSFRHGGQLFARKSHGMTVPSRPKLMLRSSKYSSSRWPSLKLPLVRC